MRKCSGVRGEISRQYLIPEIREEDREGKKSKQQGILGERVVTENIQGFRYIGVVVEWYTYTFKA